MSQLMIIDAADPLSLATILPEPLATKVRAIPLELSAQDEETLTTLVRPSAQQKRIKIQFWDEYEQAIKQDRLMSLGSIVLGVCTKEYFDEFVKADRNVAWLISPRPSYKLRVAELIDKGLDCLEEIFKIQTTPKNQIAVRRMQMDALKMLDLRKHGGYTQRIEQKTLQKNITETQNPSSPGAPALGEGSVDELQAQVKELQEKIERGKNQNGSLLNVSPTDTEGAASLETIDVTPRMVT